MDRAGWMSLLGLDEHEVPRLLVLEGTWWRQRALDARLPHLERVRELGMPDLWLGWSGDVPVAYCPAYGAPRAVEPVHVLGVVGSPLVVQIGSCGGLQPQVRTGDVVVPTRTLVGEGASRYYSDEPVAEADVALADRAEALLRARGLTVHRGTTTSTSALLQQPDDLVATWTADGLVGVDMETSAVLTVARHFGLAAAALLFVWDELPRRSWTDPLPPDAPAAVDRATAATFEVALARGTAGRG